MQLVDGHAVAKYTTNEKMTLYMWHVNVFYCDDV